MSGLAITAECPDCGGLKGAATSPGAADEYLRDWMDRGDVLHARTVEWVRSARICHCNERDAA